jgi:hypothetical protein
VDVPEPPPPLPDPLPDEEVQLGWPCPPQAVIASAMTSMENFPQTKADRDLLANGVKVSIFGNDSCWDLHLKLWIEAFQCHKQKLNRMLDLFTNAPQYLPRPING